MIAAMFRGEGDGRHPAPGGLAEEPLSEDEIALGTVGANSEASFRRCGEAE
jgi:hypothetical protein